MAEHPSDNSSANQPEFTLSEKYHAAMELLYADGEWYRLPRWIFKILPTFRVKVGEGVEETKTRLKDEAYTFAAALNQSAVRKAVSLHKGWFEFSSSQAEDDTGFGRGRIENHIRLLVNCRLLRQGKRTKKICGRRRIRINYALLVDLIHEYLNAEKTRLRGKRASGSMRGKRASACAENIQADARKTRNLVASIRTKVKKGKERECPQADNPLLKGFDPPEEGKKDSYREIDLKRAQLLADAVGKAGQMDSKSKISSWAEEFYKMHMKDKRTDEEIDELLNRLIPHISSTMHTKENGCIPTVFCAESFRAKAVRIKAQLDARDVESGGFDLAERKKLFDKAVKAAEENGNYSIKYDGSMCAKSGNTKGWIKIIPGKENQTDAPRDVIGYARYVHGEWKPKPEQI